MRTVLVTGAGRGVGRACALAFARAGDSVACAARTVAEIEAVAKECAAAGAGETLAVPFDATDPGAVATGVALVEERLGPIEVLCHATGGAKTASLARTSDTLWSEMLAVNLTSAFLVARAVLPGMVSAGRGRLVFVGSTASRTGFRYCAAYAASKHGLLGMVRSLALEVAGSGVTANLVGPGFLDVEATRHAAREVASRTKRDEEQVLEVYRATSPQRRLFTPEEVAASVRFLASDEAAGVNGQCLLLDGGAVVA